MSNREWNRNADDFILGSRRNHNSCNENNHTETKVSPTKNLVNTTTNVRTIRRVHPTHITNVNKNITRIENFYPVTQSVQNENFVEEYDCGCDLKKPCCKLIRKSRK
ncbi:CotD family spore coat protein [Bacillus subtilis]|nr:CotD family spore coat protein [Bacillus subtilis]WGE05808.1 CotD family spore coat protein [Bacillus subtilis]